MKSLHEVMQHFTVDYRYPVVFARSVFGPGSETLCDILSRAGERRHDVLPVIDSGVLAAFPDLPNRIRDYAEQHREVMALIDAPLVVRGGEICKTDPREVTQLHELVETKGICRHSFVLVIGGGSVLDAVGYAAATAHRGLRVIRMPTTVLAQNDSGVGVKNGINFRTRKNFLGTFAPPYAVINDFDFLKTLEPRDMRAGIAEAVKVALIRDARFFERLETTRTRLAGFDEGAMESMIIHCADLHLAHIRSSGDPFEAGSARPLDFGHWSAHKLEELSGHALRHGEAVAIGIAIDTLYSHRVGMLSEEALARVFRLLEDVGFELHHPALRQLNVQRAMEDFREHLGGQLTITLLSAIGKGAEVNTIDYSLMAQCVDSLAGPGRARLSR